MKRFNLPVLVALAMGSMMVLMMGSCSDDKAPYSVNTDLLGKWYVDRIMVITDTAATTVDVEPTDTMYYTEIEFKADSIATFYSYEMNYTTLKLEWSSYDLKFRENGNLINVGFTGLSYPFVFDEEDGVIHTAVDDTDDDGNEITIYYYYEKIWY